MTQMIHKGTPQQLAAWLGQFPNEKRYRVLVEEEPEADEEDSSSLQTTPNAGMLAALREIAERQKGQRYTDGSETDRLLREAHAGAMWDCEASE